MLTKRDKILIRPWEQRRYENHLRKVQSALPVIDNKPPKTREHVSHKLKKRQKEIERIAKIEHDNLILLRKMNYIMQTNRVDNCWSKPLPNFLNRVSLFETPKTIRTEVMVEFDTPVLGDHLRKSKCSACTPQKTIEREFPEERIPWDPPKIRSSSLPRQIERQKSLPTIVEKVSKKNEISKEKKFKNPTFSERLKTKSFEVLKAHDVDYVSPLSPPRKIELTRGSLKLSVNFPNDAEIKLKGPRDVYLVKSGKCFCKMTKMMT